MSPKKRVSARARRQPASPVAISTSQLPDPLANAPDVLRTGEFTYELVEFAEVGKVFELIYRRNDGHGAWKFKGKLDTFSNLEDAHLVQAVKAAWLRRGLD